MRIALEEHCLLDEPEHIDRWRTAASIIPKPIADRMVPMLTDLGNRRLDAMSAAGIDLAVLSNVGGVQGMLDPTIAQRLARQANDYLALVVQQHPTRYAAFATVPLQAPDAGAGELERAMTQLGMKGAMIFGHTNGLYLDDDRFRPFWERAEALNAPIYLHAAEALVSAPTYAGRPELIGPTFSWTAETAAHTLRLFFGGVFERHPRLRLILGHMGETIPFTLWRLDRRVEAFGVGSIVEKPSAIIRRNIAVTTAGVCSNEPLACAIGAMGAENVMFSVDHPFESMAVASAWLDAAPLTPEVREQVSWRNAKRILSL